MSILHKTNLDPLLTEQDTDLLIAYVKSEMGLDIAGYNRKSTQRRLEKMINKFQLSSGRELIRFLKGKSLPTDLFIESFVVHVTELFREPAANAEMIQKVFTRWRDKESVKIWMVGCSTGEEVLSLAILLKEHNLLKKSTIIATDLDKRVIEKPSHNIVSRYAIKKAKHHYLASGGQLYLDYYFSTVSNQCYFKEELLKNVQFKVFDLVTHEMQERFDLIWCKNVLIYFAPAYQEFLLQKLINQLNPAGFLALGERESLTFYPGKEAMLNISLKNKLYQMKS